MFKYGAPKTVIIENSSPFPSEFFRRVCQGMVIANDLTGTYQPQTNGHTKSYNRTILAMLCCYVRDHHRDWVEHIHVLIYDYHNGIHCSKNHSPFTLVLSGPPGDPKLFGYIEGNRKKACTGKK